MIITSPTDGVYLIHEQGQRSVDGTAVYRFTSTVHSDWWECQDHGPYGHPNGGTAPACEHIREVIEADLRYEANGGQL